MKRYDYIEPQFNQLLFNQTMGWLRPMRDKVKWVEQKTEEEKTIKAIEKKYNIKLVLREITDKQGHKWNGYIIERDREIICKNPLDK